MIKNIVFDVGNVLIYWEPDWIMERLGYDEETKKAINAAMFQNECWAEDDRGVLNREELLNSYIANAPAYEAQIRECYERVDQAIVLKPYAMEWVKSLKKCGYHLYIISNYGENTFEKTEKKLEFLPYMDGVIFSYRYKMIKPDHAIYEQLLKEYQLNAEECVFIDDRPENVEAALAVGYHGIVCENFEQVKAELEKVLSQASEKRKEK